MFIESPDRPLSIAFIFFGLTYALGRHNQQVDFRHCWPNINENLIEPIRKQNHKIHIFASTYPFEDKDIEKDFYDMVKPDDVYFSKYKDSNRSTSKCATFHLIENRKDIDLIIFTRFDVHFKTVFPYNQVDISKFHFLHRSLPQNWRPHKFCNDNFYIWPHSMTAIVKKALHESCLVRPSLLDTHGLYKCIIKYISPSQIKFISDKEENSAVNSICSLSIPDYLDHSDIHPDVKQRFT